MEIVRKKGIMILDDCFNANPLACREALKTLSRIAKRKRKIFVLGEMKELGKYEVKAHKEVGLQAGRFGIDYLLGFGDLTKHTLAVFEKTKAPKRTFLFDSKKELIKKAKSLMRPGDYILVKGSRAMAMEEVVKAI
jgi:UDP-N-acetylmuramoyl-tripeptide--D-alanyl-D-alanine ligase